ncbi:MAG: hypothetical protein GAK31_02988 [Stenotrophomonas maltophilia]|uniref:Uncharacterized protein n=1 Tax=Stenotrophomonas maltophilia TaxID=40324 RepID=A0A7V8JKN2_STEMA|nr:MAG: hypothetical protein GAK31_02988 [Stenotrophomonas maltophilia]
MHARRNRRWTGLVLSMALLAVAPVAWSAAPVAAAQAQGVGGYELPSAALQAVVDQVRAPSLSLSPRRDLALMLQMPALPSIQVVAQPELKLAGLRINPRTFSESRFSFGEKLWLMNVADGKERQVTGLPQPLSLATSAWSPDQKWLAFNRVDAATGANELWIIDVAAGSAWLLAGNLNTVMSEGYQWLPDSRGLVVMTQPANAGKPPVSDGIPSGPAVQQTSQGAGVVAIRTYQGLLKNEADARLIDYYALAQPLEISLEGRVREIGLPGIFSGFAVSPDGRYVLSERVQRPYSYPVRRTASARSATGARRRSWPRAIPCWPARRCRSSARATRNPTTPTSNSWWPMHRLQSMKWCGAG